MINMLIIQGIGAAAFITIALSYYQKEKREILLVELLAYILFIIHYYLLDGITGVICNLIGLFALVLIYLSDRYNFMNKKILSIFLIILIIIINILTYQNIYSIFPMIALTSVILSFLSDNENLIRIVGIISAICWLIYAIVYKSYITIIFQTIIIINTLYILKKQIIEKKH